MIKTINISKYASGSWPDRIGDTTLFYSENYTHHASDLSGLFLDNPPVLSSKHASLVWKYNADVDRYILIHVQGSHVVSRALGRIYPFRAGYEVGRDAMNAIGFAITSLMQAVPRIDAMPVGRVAEATDVDVRQTKPTEEERNFATHVMAALAEGKTLFVALDNVGEQYFCDGVFKGEFQILTGAMDALPVNLRRYASFGFCVDEHYANVLEGVLVVVYDKASQLVPPADALSLAWEEAIARPAHIGKEKEVQLKTIHLPGENEPLLTNEQLRRAFKVAAMPVEMLRDGDWAIWRALGNGFDLLQTQGWKAFKRFHAQMDDETKVAYARWACTASLDWTTEGFTEDMFNLMDYKEEDVTKLQKKALSEYLQGGRFSFLFQKGMNDEVKQMLDGNFVRSLQLNDAQLVIDWYHIFKRLECDGNSGVKAAFGKLFGELVVPRLNSMKKVVECMSKYPFIPVDYFKPPEDVALLGEVRDLKPAYREFVEQWVSEAASAFSFGDIGMLMKAFDRVLEASKNEGRSPEQMALEHVDESELSSLLAVGKESEVAGNCERLLKMARKLPKEWDDFVRDTLLPAVQHVLVGGKKGQGGLPSLSKETLLDVSKWPKIAELSKTYPLVFKVVAERLKTLFASTSSKLGGEIKEQFIYATSLKEEKKRKDEEKDGKPIKYKKDAEKAYPIISLYISTIKKSNKKMSKELEHLFRDLRKKTRNWRIIGLIAGIAIAVIFAFGGLMAGKYLFGSAQQQQEGEIAILWEGDKSSNLMSRLACLADWDSVSKVKVDTLEVPHLKLVKTADLRPLSKAYYSNLPEVLDTALVRAFLFNKKGEMEGKMDSLNVNEGSPLIESVYDKSYRIKDVTIKGKTFEIPNEKILGKDTIMSTKDAKYYLSVVNFLSKELPDSVSFAY